jgi:hypothetical protein
MTDNRGSKGWDRDGHPWKKSFDDDDVSLRIASRNMKIARALRKWNWDHRIEDKEENEKR